MPKKLETLQAEYPHLWEKAVQKYKYFQAQKNYFMALVQLEKAKKLNKEKRAKEKALKRRRRTRALILFALWELENLVANGTAKDFVTYLQDARPIKGKEGKKEIDYTPYIVEALEELLQKAKDTS